MATTNTTTIAPIDIESIHELVADEQTTLDSVEQAIAAHRRTATNLYLKAQAERRLVALRKALQLMERAAEAAAGGST